MIRTLLLALLLSGCAPEGCSQFGFGFGFRVGDRAPEAPSASGFSNVNALRFNDDASNERAIFGPASKHDIDGGANRDYSVSLWVRTQTSWSTSRGIISKYTGVAGDSPFELRTSSDGLSFIVAERVTRTATFDAPSADAWHHVAWTVDDSASAVRIWIDDVEQSPTLANGGPQGTSDSNAAGIELAARNSAIYADVDLDEVAVWRAYELTDSDVENLYNGGSPTDVLTTVGTEPILYVRCGDDPGDNGTTLVDQTSSPSDGTLENMAIGDYITGAP